MTEVQSYAPGMPSWVDLMTSDIDGARTFYGALFGWEFDIGPADTGHYTMCRIGGQPVAGMVGDPASEGMPTAWNTYMATDDTDAVVQRITDAGGNVMMGPMDVMTQGRMAFAFDPTGAAFGVWQAIEHRGAGLRDEPGSVAWNELATRDLAAAQDFYTSVFGYEWEPVDTGNGGPAYRLASVAGQSAGGAMEMTAQWPAEVPPHWMPYFAAADVDAAAARAEELGGAVRVPATDSAHGRWAVIADPQGGVFTVLEPPGSGAE